MIRLHRWKTFSSALSQNLPEDTVVPEDVAALFFTSGTTGDPKGAMQNQRNVQAAIRGGEVYTACASGKEAFLGVLPLFNNFGATVVLNGALYNGGTLVLRERWDLDGVVADIERHKISVFFGTPTMFTFLLKAYDPLRHDLSSLRLCLAGGAVLVPSLIEEFEKKLKTRLINIYGATEVSTYVTAEPLMGPRISGSVGLPIGSTTISVLDDSGHPVERGQTGEIAIGGDTVGPGYWQDVKATAIAFRNGAWLSGDIGFVDDHDHLHIIDRKKDVIISGGYNIYPIEVEDVLYKRDDVHLCALIGAPDVEKGELPVAYVVPAAGKSPTADELIAHCRTHLAAYKAPRRVVFKDALPLGPTGKILKKGTARHDFKGVTWVMRLVNKVALITGAGGPMGRAIAQKLSCEGASLALTDISGNRLNETVEAIAAAHPQCQAIQQRANGIDAKEAAEVAGVALERFGKVDILVNVVGGIRSKQLYTPFLEMTEQQWDDTFALNLKPGFHLIRRPCSRHARALVWQDRQHFIHRLCRRTGAKRLRSGQSGRCILDAQVWPVSSRPTSTSIALHQVSYVHP